MDDNRNSAAVKLNNVPVLCPYIDDSPVWVRHIHQRPGHWFFIFDRLSGLLLYDNESETEVDGFNLLWTGIHNVSDFSFLLAP